MTAMKVSVEHAKTKVIDEGIFIKGNNNGNGDLIVEGRVEGNIFIDGEIMVSKIGVVKGNIEAQSAVIGGAVLGNILAPERVVFQPTGRMIGNISSKIMQINEGAAFRGKIDMGLSVEQLSKEKNKSIPSRVSLFSQQQIEESTAKAI
jgi:cytoskeletal protein CcmA (bactofilin family)